MRFLGLFWTILLDLLNKDCELFDEFICLSKGSETYSFRFGLTFSLLPLEFFFDFYYFNNFLLINSIKSPPSTYNRSCLFYLLLLLFKYVRFPFYIITWSPKFKLSGEFYVLCGLKSTDDSLRMCLVGWLFIWLFSGCFLF